MQTARRITFSDLPDYQAYRALREFLMTRTGWTVQSTITAETGLSGVEVRQICNAYPALAIGSTQGYKLASYASTAEVQHAVSTLMNRSIKMLQRAQALSGKLA